MADAERPTPPPNQPHFNPEIPPSSAEPTPAAVNPFLSGSGIGGCTFFFRSLANVPVLFMNRTGKKSVIFPC